MFLHTLLALASLPVAFAKVQFLGVAIAGGDFGCQIDGTCPASSVQFAGDAADQMSHFVGEGMNLMRIPTSWQFLVNNQLGGDLDDGNLAKYDQLVQACLSTGAHCMIDIHNFARWNGGIIGQGGPSDDQFVSFWTQLASKYATNDNIVFEIMNEPHDLDIDLWAQTCQKVVTAIRNAGATSQMILLPGTNFDSAATLVSSGSADKMMAITNPDGSTNGLVLDIHKYLDEDNSGTHQECVTNNIDAFTELAQYLRSNGRQGLVSESGASSDASCLTNFCSQNAFINQNSDVFVGFVAWAAGSFSTSYVLSLTPSKQNGQYVDNTLMTQCVFGPWLSSSNTSTPTTTSQVASSTTSTSFVSSSSSSSPSSSSSTISSSPQPSSAAAAATTTTGVASIVLSGASIVIPSTWSLLTVTSLLIDTEPPTMLPPSATAYSGMTLITAATSTSATSSASATAASSTSPVPTSGSASTSVLVQSVVARLLVCSLLVLCFL